MVSLLQAFLMSIGIAALVLLSVLFGGWLVFKSKAAPGERLLGPTPKGTVFTIPHAASAPDIADEAPDKRMLERTEQFMEKLLGGK